MKAVRVVGYHQNLEQADVSEPKVEGPLDVIVKIGAAGVCRTDIHILEGVSGPLAKVPCYKNSRSAYATSLSWL